MKTIGTTILLLILGVGLGFEIQPRLLEWFLSASGERAFSIQICRAFIPCAYFSLLNGVLFSTSVVMAHVTRHRIGFARGTFLYMGLGVGTAGILALYQHLLLAANAADVSKLPAPAVALVSLDAIPNLGIPIAGLLAVVVAGLLVRFGASQKNLSSDVLRFRKISRGMALCVFYCVFEPMCAV